MPEPVRGRWDRMSHVERFDYTVGLEAELVRCAGAIELLSRMRTYLAIPPEAAAKFEERNADLIADVNDFLNRIDGSGGEHDISRPRDA